MEEEDESEEDEEGEKPRVGMVGFAHKDSLLITNRDTSTLPSIFSSHVQVQDPISPNEKPKEVPFMHLVKSFNFGISDEEVSPKGNIDIFPCNVEHEVCHDTKPSEEKTSHNIQGNKAIFYTPKNLNCCDVAHSS